VKKQSRFAAVLAQPKKARFRDPALSSGFLTQESFKFAGEIPCTAQPFLAGLHTRQSPGKPHLARASSNVTTVPGAGLRGNARNLVAFAMSDLLPFDLVKFANDDPPGWMGMITSIEGADAFVVLARKPGASWPRPGEVGAGESRVSLDQLQRIGTLRTGRGGTDPAEEALGRQLLADWRGRTGEPVEVHLFEQLRKKPDEPR
jgi:hypothetical protein